MFLSLGIHDGLGDGCGEGVGKAEGQLAFGWSLLRCGLAGREQNLHCAEITAVTQVELLRPEIPRFPSSWCHRVCGLAASSASDEADGGGNAKEGRGGNVLSLCGWRLSLCRGACGARLARRRCLYAGESGFAEVWRQLGSAGAVALAHRLPRAGCRAAECPAPVWMVASVRVPGPWRRSRRRRLGAASCPEHRRCPPVAAGPRAALQREESEALNFRKTT